MTEKFFDEINDLKSDVITFSWFAEQMLKNSIEALINLDKNLAKDVKKRKKELVQTSYQIEEKIFSIIALYQPVARDMRTVVCSLGVVNAAERIGTYGKDIANIVRDFPERPHIENLVSIPHMADLVIDIIGDTINSYELEDISLLAKLSERDDVVDSLKRSIFRECITYMMEDPRNIAICTHYVMIGRYLERSADHACRVAEKVHYMVTGERVEIK